MSESGEFCGGPRSVGTWIVAVPVCRAHAWIEAVNCRDRWMNEFSYASLKRNSVNCRRQGMRSPKPPKTTTTTRNIIIHCLHCS